MKRTAVCSVLFFAMFMVLAGILCMGVAAEENITLVNPFDSSDTFKVSQSDDVIAYKAVISDKQILEDCIDTINPILDVPTLAGALQNNNTVIFITKSFSIPENVTIDLHDYNNVWLIGSTENIEITNKGTTPFTATSGSTTLASLKIDGAGSYPVAGIEITGGTLTLKDVTVTNCTGGGVRVTGDGKINVSGSTTIIGNKADNKDSNLRSASPVNVIDKLTGNIGIDMTDNATGIAATGDILATDKASVNAFSLDGQSGYKPTLDAENKLIFTESGSTDPDPGQGDTKESSVGIKVDGSIDADNNKVTFRITTNVPQCIGDYIPFTGTVDGPSVQRVQSANKRGTYMLVFHNTLDSKLSIDPESLKLTVKSKEIDNSLYTVEYDNLTDGCTFEFRVNLVELYNKGYYTLEDVTTTPPDVVLTFDAVPKEGRLSGQYTDTAYINYGPYSDESKLTPTVKTTVTVGLYTVTVFKYDQENQTKGLAGATFILNKVEGETATPIATGTTDDNGYCVFSGLEAGNYELVESEAPEGYAKSDKSYSFTCDRDITVNFANVKLPHTGGIGYKLPVTIGIICVICGGAFIAVGRKKKNNK